MLFRNQEADKVIKIKVKEGILKKANEVFLAQRPFAKKTDLDELFEQLITLASIKLGLVTNDDLGITNEEYKALQDVNHTPVIPEVENNGTLINEDKEPSALNLLN